MNAVDLLLCLPLLAATPEATPLARLAFLEGTWVGGSAAFAEEETWSAADRGGMVGMHRDSKDGRLVSYEYFRIVPADSGRLAYVTSPNGQSPTTFTSIELTDRRVVFENRAHDFPQRILYWLEDSGALHARIEGHSKGKPRAMDWVWTRKPCR